MSQLELKMVLVLAIVCPIMMVYSLTQRELLSAAALALTGVSMARVYRLEKRRSEEPQ